MCMTHALSKADDEKGRRACDHQHSPKCELMRQDVTLLYTLRETITLYSNDTDHKDHLWSLDRVEGLMNEWVVSLVSVCYEIICNLSHCCVCIDILIVLWLLHLLPLLVLHFRHMISWYTHSFWIFKVSGLNYFFLLKLWSYPSRSYSWNSKKKNHGWRRKICTPHGQHIPVSNVRIIPILFYYESRKRELQTRLIYHTWSFILLWIKKTRAKDKTYIWGSVWWKTQKLKMRNLHASHTLGCVTPAVIHT